MELEADGPQPFYERLLERLPAGAYACDPEGRITWYNEAAVRVWGRRPALDDAGERFCGSLRLLHADGRPMPHEDCWMARALRDQQSYAGRPLQIERPDGERVHALAYASPIHDEKGRLLGAVHVLVDVSEHERAGRAARKNEADLEDFFENSVVPLHWVGADGTILRANQAELDLLGYPREEYVGRHIADFHADSEIIEDILRRLLAGEELRRYEARLRHKDGSIREVQISSNGRFEDGVFLQTRCFTIDVTDQRRAERALSDVNRRKDEFLAMLAHELRNPLAPMQSAVDLLNLEGPPDPRLQRARDVIERQLGQMSRLVDDLFDVARITLGKLRVDRRRVALQEVVDHALETARPLTEERRHRLTVSLPEEPIWVEADPVRLSQVLVNLLRNAAHYTEREGQLELSAAAFDRGGRSLVRITVRDDGRGLTRDEIARIFDMFEQATGPEQVGRQTSGLGIGLTIVQKLVDLHGGSIEAHSEGLGCGSEFRIELPAAEAPRGESAAPERAETTARRRVLVVDDNEDSAIGFQMLLDRLGHDSAVAHSGADALKEAERFEPEIVLLDIGLPDIDGFEVCRRLRDHPATSDALLVAVTGWGQEEHKRRSREAGFDLHLTKPVRLPALRELLARSERR